MVLTNPSPGAIIPFKELTAKEQRVVLLLRGISFGTLTVHMQDGEPVRVERITESVKL